MVITNLRDLPFIVSGCSGFLFRPAPFPDPLLMDAATATPYQDATSHKITISLIT